MPIDLPRIEPIHCDFLARHQVVLSVLRLDQIHPTIHGNKWFKLKPNIEQMQRQGINRILSFGGAYSNHIYALAAAGKLYDLETIGLIRGEINDSSNPILSFAKKQGMQLVGVSRSAYRHKHEPDFLAKLRSDFGEFYLLPEGGSNELAVDGCMEIANYIEWRTTDRPRIVALACGTGTTLSGLVCGLASQATVPTPAVYGVSVLKAPGYMRRQIDDCLGKRKLKSHISWKIMEQYHCGGYAKSSPQLRAFLDAFKRHSRLPLEPVYTGKLFYALFEMLKCGELPPNCELLAIHTGGTY